jgi:hypothetical protein
MCLADIRTMIYRDHALVHAVRVRMRARALVCVRVHARAFVRSYVEGCVSATAHLMHAARRKMAISRNIRRRCFSSRESLSLSRVLTFNAIRLIATSFFNVVPLVEVSSIDGAESRA